MTNWKKLKEQVPEFEKLILVKTKRSAYAVTALSSITSHRDGIKYEWHVQTLIDGFLDHYGEIVEWCEIPE